MPCKTFLTLKTNDCTTLRSKKNDKYFFSKTTTVNKTLFSIIILVQTKIVLF